DRPSVVGVELMAGRGGRSVRAGGFLFGGCAADERGNQRQVGHAQEPSTRMQVHCFHVISTCLVGGSRLLKNSACGAPCRRALSEQAAAFIVLQQPARLAPRSTARLRVKTSRIRSAGPWR